MSSKKQGLVLQPSSMGGTVASSSGLSAGIAGTMIVNPEEAPASGTVVVASGSGDGDYLEALRSNAAVSSG